MPALSACPKATVGDKVASTTRASAGWRSFCMTFAISPDVSRRALDFYVTLPLVVEHPLVGIADVGASLLRGVFDELLPILQDLLHLLLHVLRLALK